MTTISRPLHAIVALAVALFLSGADAPAKRIKPAAEHLFFRCKLLINPSSGETIPDALIETDGGKVLRGPRRVSLRCRQMRRFWPLAIDTSFPG
jgi:hypothetical protein